MGGDDEFSEADLLILDEGGDGISAVATITAVDYDTDAVDRAVSAIEDEFGEDRVQS